MIFAAFLLGFLMPSAYFFVALTAARLLSDEPTPPQPLPHSAVVADPWDGVDGGTVASPDFIEVR